MKLLSKISLFLLATALTFAFSGCKDEDEPKTSNLDFNFEFTVDGQALAYGTDIQINGVTVNIETAAFYVSGIEIMPETGSALTADGTHLLVSVGSGAQSVLKDIEPGHYHMASFDIGVQADANSQTETDFTTRASDDPLAAQMPAMHWNWNSGYKFLRIDGVTDTDGDGTPETPLAFHLGTNALLTPVSYDLHHDLEPGDNTLTFEFDLANFFEGVDLSTQTDTHTMNDLPLAQKVAGNLSTAISVKE